MRNRKLHRLKVMLMFVAVTCIHPFVPVAVAEVQPIETSGASYGELAARWWEWAFSIPAAQNPILDTTGENCAQDQTGNAWFLAGTFGSAETRTCTIPAGKSIFLPLFNVVSFGPLPGETTNTLRQQAADFVNLVTGLNCTLDGKPCAKDLFAFRAQSPIFEAIVPADGLVDPNFYDPMVADGYWLLFDPLKAGSHMLVFGAETSIGFSPSVTYHLTVQ